MSGEDVRASAERLAAAAGQTEAAVALLHERSEAGDPQAMFVLGVWHAAGERLPRDLAAARTCFEAAAAAGEPQARRVLINFQAAGVGGPRLWEQALAGLARLAETDAHAAKQHALIAAMDLNEGGEPRAIPTAEPLSAAPDVRLLPGLLTPAECDYLVRAALPLMRPSLVVDERTGTRIRHPIRTADAALFTWALENPAVHAINRRIAAASGTEAGQGEPLQVLRYAPGQEYRPHLDALAGLANQRAWTMLVWLNEDFEGGETAFTETELRVRGRRGDALLFGNLAGGRPDPLSAHAGLPVTRGTKFMASRWIRERSFEG